MVVVFCLHLHRTDTSMTERKCHPVLQRRAAPSGLHVSGEQSRKPHDFDYKHISKQICA